VPNEPYQVVIPNGPPEYVIFPCKSLIVDFSNTFFVPPEYNKEYPDEIGVFFGKGMQYFIPWKPGKMVYEINADTVKPLDRYTPPFPGFLPGRDCEISLTVFYDNTNAGFGRMIVYVRGSLIHEIGREIIREFREKFYFLWVRHKKNTIENDYREKLLKEHLLKKEK
jgi:hypothetical protein